MNKQHVADFIFEASLVKRTQRTGWQFFGDHAEGVGEHSFMTAVIAYTLGRLAGADIKTILLMSIFHDFHESRTGEFDKVMKFYATRHTERANEDIFKDFDPELFGVINDYEKRESLEAQITYEANILAFLVELKLLHEKGNSFAKSWYERNAIRLKRPDSQALAEALFETDSQAWWKSIKDKIIEDYKK